MSKEIEKYLIKKITNILNNYLKDFSTNNIAKVSFFPQLQTKPSFLLEL